MTNSKTYSVAGLAKEKAVGKMVEEAGVLMSKHETWKTTDLARTNRALYGILAEVYGLYVQAQKKEYLGDLVKELKEKLEEKKVRVQENTRALTVLVRYVFSCDRQRAYNYVQTLLAAEAAGATQATVVEFIELNNGVEQCKREQVKTAAKVQKEQQQAEAEVLVKDALLTKAELAKVKLANVQVALKDDTHFTFLMAKQVTDGEFAIVGAVPLTTAAMEKLALKQLAQEYLAQQAEADTTSKEQAAGDAVQAACAGMKKLEASNAEDEELALAA